MKTSELTGYQLNYAVAIAEGMDAKGVVYAWQGQAKLKIQRSTVPCEYDEVTFNYAGDWAQGGLIIERENICLWTEGYDWEAKQYGVWEEWGPTPLIAAMRCYVGSKLGNEVDVPEGLK